MRAAQNRRNRIIFALLIASSLVAALFNFYPQSYAWFREKVYPNSIAVNTNTGVNKERVSIIWCEEKSRCDTIFTQGDATSKKFIKAGRNSFQVFYEDSLVGIFSHLKKENTAGHTYTFNLKKEFSRVSAELIVSD